MAASAPIMTIADNMMSEFAGLYLNLPSHSYVSTKDDTTITTEKIMSRVSIIYPLACF